MSWFTGALLLLLAAALLFPIPSGGRNVSDGNRELALRCNQLGGTVTRAYVYADDNESYVCLKAEQLHPPGWR